MILRSSQNTFQVVVGVFGFGISFLTSSSCRNLLDGGSSRRRTMGMAKENQQAKSPQPFNEKHAEGTGRELENSSRGSRIGNQLLVANDNHGSLSLVFDSCQPSVLLE